MLTRHTPRATLAATCVSDGTALAHALQDHFLTHPVSAKNVAIRLALVVGVATHSQKTPSIDHLIKQANLSMLHPIQPSEREISYPLPKA